jgi:hypothetical protein
MVYLSGRSEFKTRRNNCAAQPFAWCNVKIALGQRPSTREKLKSIILRVVEVRDGES